jgi:hypothetical protein
MQAKNSIDFQKNNTPFFRYKEEPSPPIDASFTNFPIPSAKDLYYKIIEHGSYELVSALSLDEIKSSTQCDIESLCETINIEVLSNSLTYYTFYFKHSDLTPEALALREQFYTSLNDLRRALFNQEKLFLDDTSLSFHFSSTETYDFLANGQKSTIPNTYRALCIYDFIIEDLYLHNLSRKDSDYKNSLISDYLSIHNIQFDGLGWNYAFEVSKKFQQCLKDITCDRKAAGLLKGSFEETFRGSEFDRGVMHIIPLTANAYLSEKPNSNRLNNYSHHYCSLIQYRYLLNLKCLSLSLTNEKKRSYEKMDAKQEDFSHLELKKELEQVKKQMAHWKDFKNQPMITKYERLVDKINDMRRNAKRFEQGMWTSCYWEESILKNEQKDKILFIKALNTQVSERLFPKNFAIAIQNEMTQLSNNMLMLNRHNMYHVNDSFRYNEGYFLSIKQADLAKCPLNNLLIYTVNGLSYLKNTDLVPQLLSNTTFFETKKPCEWVTFLENKQMVTDDLKRYIWEKAIWPKVNELQKQDAFLGGNYLPIEILGIIITLFVKILEQENLVNLNSYLRKVIF